ncbi:DNA mismatch endonuclease Vsr [Mesorhizobium sp. B2-2-4]|uniref:very short patch repair endonuclease n=1 Tax=unclassified Mesorhizobium TaxID=325217 RepID=UPI001129261A|nr:MULTISPECIES: very short patch repair endonuclease [unclassified Mesorhizobium]TPM61113.1 DNA mismatch endonuclease Vsr [Mesorhizobium sp. B2-2-4]TPM70544.1 DNA mismatch endonuclease Vsr [Mesorhizobium sp. B2-2-1]TPN70397.1 DNA mismatch endonuclease Vsr [Mesorhizobium sp. B1-1-3]
MVTVDVAARSAMMSRVRNRDTEPERFVRSCLFRAGLRFRLHDKTLPGCPDVVLKRSKTAIFVHGCFWHGHSCKRGTRPVSNAEFWNAKIDRNIERDKIASLALRELGWHVEVIWNCDRVAQTEALIPKIRARVR